MSSPDTPQPAGRMIAFVDAAVAIALTLLVLPLAELVPEARSHHVPASEIVLENLAPIGSFLLSFVVIARFWWAHHRLFGWVRVATRPLIGLNLLWVLTIVVLPFPTEMVGAYGSEPFVVRFYVLVLLACSACLTAMTAVIRRSSTSGEGPSDAYLLGSATATGLFGLALILVVVVPAVNYWALLVQFLDPAVERTVTAIRRRHAASPG